MAASPNGKRLAIALTNGDVVIWDVATNQQVDVIAARFTAGTKFPAWVTALAWSPNAKQLAIATSDGIELWKL